MIVAPAPYLPFLDAHKGRPPGMFALPPEDWIEIDAAYAAQMAYRDQIVAAEGPRAVDALAEAAPAAAELADALLAHLLDRCPDGFRREGGAIRRPDGALVPASGDLSMVARLVQEDFCLLARSAGEAEHRLIGAALCFPSHWRLEDKIGRPLSAIHGPVPGYETELAPRVERLHAALSTSRSLQRLNHSVQALSELRLDGRVYERPPSDALFLRVERQTLRRLPQTRAVAFGIKTYVTPMDALDVPARLALAERLAPLTAEERAYKGGEAFVAAAIARLRRSADALDAS